MTDTALLTPTKAPAPAAFLRKLADRTRLRDVAILGFVGTLLLAVTSPVRKEAAPAWRITLPLLSWSDNGWYVTVVFIVGCLILGAAWWGLGTYAADRRIPVRTRVRMVAAVGALWCAPVLLAPPMLSNDVYSYAAQGELASRGVDPTTVGPIALGGGPFLRAADGIWWDNPSPYGPVWNKLGAGVVVASGHDPALSVWGFRVVVTIGVIMAAWAVVALAKDNGVDPAVALALGVANPLVIVYLVGGIHNDGFMLGLMLAGLALARRHHRVLGLLLVTAAVAVKLPAAVGLVYLGWNWHEDTDSRVRRMGNAVMGGLIGGALILAMSSWMRMSMGWMGALKGTSKITSTFAPMTLLGRLAAQAFGAVGISVNEDHMVTAFRGLGLLLAAGLAWTLLHHCRRLGIERALGLTMLIVIVLGPVVWPWYLPPAIALLAAGGIERYRPALWLTVVSVSLFVFPVTEGASLGLNRFQAPINLALLALIALGAAVAQWLAGEPVPGLDRRRAARADASGSEGTSVTSDG